MDVVLRSICCCILLTTSLLAASETTQFYYENHAISVIASTQSEQSYMRSGLDLIQVNGSTQYHIGDAKNVPLALNENQNNAGYQSTDFSGYGHTQTPLIFSYDGTYQDPQTQLLYLSARDYDSASERFVTSDSYPVWNHYNFANANPIMFIDPTGHFPTWAKVTLNIATVLTAFMGGRMLGKIDEDYDMYKNLQEEMSQLKEQQQKPLQAFEHLKQQPMNSGWEVCEHLFQGLQIGAEYAGIERKITDLRSMIRPIKRNMQLAKLLGLLTVGQVIATGIESTHHLTTTLTAAGYAFASVATPFAINKFFEISPPLKKYGVLMTSFLSLGGASAVSTYFEEKSSKASR